MKLACRMLLSVVERTGGSLAIETGKLPTHVVAGKVGGLGVLACSLISRIRQT